MSHAASLSIDRSATIRDALAKLDETAKGILFLVDDDERFVRTVTDGDLRRLLLHGSTLDDTLHDLPDLASVTASETTPASELQERMLAAKVTAVPVLDDQRRVTRLATLADLQQPILLSIPHLGDHETHYVNQAFESNWVAPLGPNVTGFEEELAAKTGTGHAAALSSGTAALHLALIILGIKPGDEVYCPSLTFVASVNPVLYEHATPVLIDSEPGSWNMSPAVLAKALEEAAGRNALPRAVVVVNLYGHIAEYAAIRALCDQYDIPIIEDAAESLGATCAARHSGSFGDIGVFSFNGNKIITTSGGGMLVSANEDYVARARWLSTQAKDDAPYYEHSVVGYNYRMSNVLAGIGRGQLKVLDDRVARRREIYARYREALADTGEFEWIEELPGSTATHWLSAVLLRRGSAIDPQSLIASLATQDIEARRIWNPLHRTPLYRGHRFIPHPDGSVADDLFERGVCLPSSSNMTDTQQQRVIDAIRHALARGR